MPTLISNENYAIRWDKTECNQYTITNLSDEYNAHVTITDETGTWVEEFDLTPLGSNTIILPGDGVFKICAYLFDVPIELEDQAPTNGLLSIASFFDDPNTELLYAVFEEGGGGLGVSVDPTDRSLINGALFAAELQVWITANGGGIVTYLEPGDTLPGLGIDLDPLRYYIIVQANTYWMPSVWEATPFGEPPQPGEPVTADTNLFCSYNYLIPVDNNWIFSLIINGTEVVPANTGWDMSTQEGVDAAILEINTFLGNDGIAGGSILSLNIYLVNGSPKNDCSQVVLTTGIYGPGETQCDYIYEFCDLYACLSRLMNRWLCQDPCADKCTTAGESYEEARRKAVELSTMFFHALMPLVTTDRLWYLGNWDISDQRLCNVNNILELYKKMRDYVKNCGFDCGCGCPDNCSDCQPCNGYSYAPSPSNPSTPCGCK